MMTNTGCVWVLVGGIVLVAEAVLVADAVLVGGTLVAVTVGAVVLALGASVDVASTITRGASVGVLVAVTVGAVVGVLDVSMDVASMITGAASVGVSVGASVDVVVGGGVADNVPASGSCATASAVCVVARFASGVSVAD